MFTFLVTLGLAAFSHARPVVGSVALGLGALTRPDGMLIGGLAVVWQVVESLLREVEASRHSSLSGLASLLRAPGRSLRATLTAVLPFAALVTLHVVFRLYYYGEWLPNTYYAKVDQPWPEMGARYVLAFVLEYGLLPFAVAASALLIFRRLDWRPFARAAFVFVPHAAYYAFLVGGDHFEYRIFDCVWPTLTLLAADVLATLAANSWRAFGTSGPPGNLSPWPLSHRALTRSAVRIVGIALAGYLLLMMTFPAHWWRFVPEGTIFGRSGVPVEEPRRILGAWRAIPFLERTLTVWKEMLLKMQYHQAGVRMEEHRLFWQKRRAQFAGFEGIPLPSSAVTEDGGIGILGFFVDVVVLDRLGLTDAVVARSVHAGNVRMIAHNRRPPPGYFLARGLSFYPLCLLPESPVGLAEIAERCPEGYEFVPGYGRVYVAQLQRGFMLFASPLPDWPRRTFPDVTTFDYTPDRRHD